MRSCSFFSPSPSAHATRKPASSKRQAISLTGEGEMVLVSLYVLEETKMNSIRNMALSMFFTFSAGNEKP